MDWSRDVDVVLLAQRSDFGEFWGLCSNFYDAAGN
jgi:hypothetical protein